MAYVSIDVRPRGTSPVISVRLGMDAAIQPIFVCLVATLELSIALWAARQNVYVLSAKIMEIQGDIGSTL